jgi:hypothetical protein
MAVSLLWTAREPGASSVLRVPPHFRASPMAARGASVELWRPSML